MNEDNKYINIKDVAEAKGLTSTRSLRLELNKIESKYISREIKVNGGTSYEILFSSLEPEIQQKLREAENKTTALVPHGGSSRNSQRNGRIQVSVPKATTIKTQAD